VRRISRWQPRACHHGAHRAGGRCYCRPVARLGNLLARVASAQLASGVLGYRYAWSGPPSRCTACRLVGRQPVRALRYAQGACSRTLLHGRPCRPLPRAGPKTTGRKTNDVRSAGLFERPSVCLERSGHRPGGDAPDAANGSASHVNAKVGPLRMPIVPLAVPARNDAVRPSVLRPAAPEPPRYVIRVDRRRACEPRIPARQCRSWQPRNQTADHSSS